MYDANGNQLLRQDGTTTTLFLPGEQIVLNASTHAVTGTRFIALPGGGQVVRTGSGTNYSFEIDDQHGTSTLMLDSTAQNPTWRQFTPYGAPRGTTPVTWPDHNSFLGDPTDNADGLTAIGAREYDATIGQFISLDPQLNPSDPQSLNGYTYAGDDPVTESDPSGLCPADRCGGGVPKGGSGGGYTKGPIDPSDPGAGITWGGDSTSLKRERAARRREARHTVAVAHSYEQQIEREIAQLKHERQMLIQAQQISFLRLALTNTGAILSDAGAAATEEIPGLDVAADANAYSMTREALAEDIQALSSGDGGAANVSQAIAQDEAALRAENLVVATETAVASCSNSFSGTTLVLMADGSSKPIDQIRVGDTIANAQPGALIGTGDEHHKVTAVHVTRDDQAYTDVTVNTGHGSSTITGTAYHLYWDATTRAWTPADKLRIGDRLQSSQGAPVTIVALRDYTTSMVTYNLTIDNLHDYYVFAGAAPVLVHNDNDGDWNVLDDFYIVRGGQSAIPPAGETFSGAMGTSVAQAAGAVPHGSIRVTTAGEIRAAGGTVEYAPEVGPGGSLNYNHVNVTMGTSNSFGEIEANPVPKRERMTPEALGSPRC